VFNDAARSDRKAAGFRSTSPRRICTRVWQLAAGRWTAATVLQGLDA
jgi:hypothetical protein